MQTQVKSIAKTRNKRLEYPALLAGQGRIKKPAGDDMSTYSGAPKDSEAAMTFAEIGRELGISTQGAAQLFRSGIKKLRGMHFEKVWQLRAMSEERQRIIKRYDWPADPWAEETTDAAK